MLTEIMGSYLDDIDHTASGRREFSVPFGVSTAGRMPVVPKSGGWSEDRSQRCLTRSYDFRDHSQMCDFVREVLDYETETGHYGRIECNFPTVTLSVKTHDLDAVTEVDRDYASHCDGAYDDVLHYSLSADSDDIP